MRAQAQVSSRGAFNFYLPGYDIPLSDISSGYPSTTAGLGTVFGANVHQTSATGVSMVGSTLSDVQQTTSDGVYAVASCIGMMADFVMIAVDSHENEKISSVKCDTTTQNECEVFAI